MKGEELGIELPEGLRCVTAPNSGPMTGSGTNTFIVGIRDVAIIDPGPDDPRHLKGILDAIPPNVKVSNIVVTHSHLDHTALAHRLSDHVSAPVFAMCASEKLGKTASLTNQPDEIGGGEGVDRTFVPDFYMTDGDTLQGQDWALEAIHTPGHLRDHMCLAWKQASAIFTGDHVMEWSSTFVSPPDGNMRDYMRSLDVLLQRSEALYFPAHGPRIEDGHTRIRELRAHRMQREYAILCAVRAGNGTTLSITQAVYQDIPAQMHHMAARNVLAHLIHLETEGKISSSMAGGGSISYSIPENS